MSQWNHPLVTILRRCLLESRFDLGTKSGHYDGERLFRTIWRSTVVRSQFNSSFLFAHELWMAWWRWFLSTLMYPAASCSWTAFSRCTAPEEIFCRRATGTVPENHSYNEGMGGVDLMDCFLATYWPRIWGKNWYRPLFSDALNLSAIAAWHFHCQLRESWMSHLDSVRHRLSFCWWVGSRWDLHAVLIVLLWNSLRPILNIQ